jgi:hypothetical protein
VLGSRLSVTAVHTHHCPLSHLGAGWAPIAAVSLQEAVVMRGYAADRAGVAAYTRDVLARANWPLAADMVAAARHTCVEAVAAMVGAQGSVASCAARDSFRLLTMFHPIPRRLLHADGLID